MLLPIILFLFWFFFAVKLLKIGGCILIMEHLQRDNNGQFAANLVGPNQSSLLRKTLKGTRSVLTQHIHVTTRRGYTPVQM